ncbi:MAG: acetyl-CoA carboxylase carboxyltransferase subunit alpha [Rhodocyclales bacterium]|nr:acetyl-CoA carboxylase carboxyltransferase subunit alpha [Rhodocyclales bacterium]
MDGAYRYDFERPIAELTSRLTTLRKSTSATSEPATIRSLEAQLEQLKRRVYGNLTAWQRVQLARHPLRPYTLDYLTLIMSEFVELHGDRLYGDDKAMVGGVARLNGQKLLILGHQKGRDTKENLMRNFGSAHPEGYRKALRLMRLAERFGMPVFTFVDTPGAYPGIDAEERGQSEAIGRNLYEMAELKVPLITTIIGEGGSGGALAIAVGDAVLMLQYSTYSVISPEGCASILWKSSEKAGEAAEIMGITASRLKTLGLVDRVITEPAGGAHRDHRAMAVALKKALQDQLKQLVALSTTELIERRFERIMAYGRFKEIPIH